MVDLAQRHVGPPRQDVHVERESYRAFVDGFNPSFPARQRAATSPTVTRACCGSTNDPSSFDADTLIRNLACTFFGIVRFRCSPTGVR